MTIKELINQGNMMLKNEGIESPKNKARTKGINFFNPISPFLLWAYCLYHPRSL